MNKPTVELIRFDASDVIATSGPVTLTVSNFKDGTNNNLSIKFGNNTYKGYSQKDAFLSALGNKYTDKTDRYPGGDYGEGLGAYFDAEYYNDGTEFQWELENGINGTYTWYAAGNYWKHN